MDARVPLDWAPVVRRVKLAHGAVALLLYGSRAPNWPEPPIAESDYDLLAVLEDGERERRRDALPSGGPAIDLQLVSKRGFRSGQLLSPETHVMLRYGTRLGDWSWLDPGIRLSWMGADDALDDAKALLDAAVVNSPDNPDSVCRLALEAVRKCLALEAALGTLQEAPTWALAIARYGLDHALISRARSHSLVERGAPEVAAWARSSIVAAQRAIDEAGRAVLAYPRNSSDAEVASLVR